jgi:hypothetical protein
MDSAGQTPEDRRGKRVTVRNCTSKAIIRNVAGGGDGADGAPPRFLLDTNAFIALEPYAGKIEPGLNPAATLVRLPVIDRRPCGVIDRPVAL